MRANTIREIVEGHDTIVCAGSGGVGKTTTSAAIALWGAMQGRRVVVLTIDPAKRLADSMGVDLGGGTVSQVAPEVFDECGLEVPGSLSAMMLDQKGAWDALVERHAPNPAVRARILKNRFYQHLSESFAGSQEYMAVEELCNLQESGLYDLIVVDTPPSQHALDFLQAPARLADFLDRGVVRWFVKPYLETSWSLMNRTVGFVMRKLEEATGVGVLSEVSDFFGSMSSLFDGISERIDRVYRALRGSGTAFVLVSGPEEQVLEEAEYLEGQMKALGMPLEGVVFNRVHTEFVGALDEDAFPQGVLGAADVAAISNELVKSGVKKALARRLAENLLQYEDLARGDQLRMEQFVEGLGSDVPVVVIPNFSTDLHRLDALTRMHPHLFGDPE